MNEQIKNMLIGLFVVIACSLIVGIILFIEPSVGDGKQTFVVRFSNINGIAVGTRVVFAGKPVGEVRQIETIPDARDQPVDQWGNVYYYQLILSVDSHLKVYNTDEFTVQTSGLLGDKSIAIIPRSPPKHVVQQLVTSKTPVYAQSIDPLQSAFTELGDLSEKIGVAVDKIVSWFDRNEDSLSEAVSSFGNAMSGVATTMNRVNQLDLVEGVKRATDNFADTMELARDAIETLENEQTFVNAGVLIDNLKNASISVREIVSDVSKGKGTIGKLFADDTTYLQVNAILSKVDTTMNDINQYGLMFNMNKQWQRTRTKYAAFLNSVSTPDQFEQYFENQVDLINTAMGRISMLIEKAETHENRQRILQTPAFRKDFSDMMRQVDVMYENLRLYNQGLMEALKDQCECEN
ncbi:MAG: MlaD family protein [Rhabdochlamydiaceae bacterium]|nr:MlaD family protein [Candidatus Amphrikana amoebophyrae]